jgi:hypothetical protein
MAARNDEGRTVNRRSHPGSEKTAQTTKPPAVTLPKAG